MKLGRRAFLAGTGAGLAYLATGLPTRAAVQATSALAAAPTAPFATLEATGPPREVGLAHGRALRKEIARTADFYKKWLGGGTGRTEDELLAEAARYAAPVKKYCPQLWAEIRGIAEGAGQPREVILMINARTDLLVTAQAEVVQSAPGCTSLAVVGGSGDRSCIAVGQNWDWLPAMQPNTCLLRIKEDERPPLVTLTEAGMVGKIGMNGQLGVCLNFLEHKSDDPQAEPGVPIHLLLRAVMACTTLEEVEKILRAWPRSASANFLVAEHRQGFAPRAWDFELTPTRIGLIKLGQQNGQSLYHTNHYLAPDLAAGCASGHGISTMNRAKQADRLTRSVSPGSQDPAQEIMTMLRDRTGAPYSISRTPGPESKTMTLAGVVMDLTKNCLFVCQGPTHEHAFVQLPGA